MFSSLDKFLEQTSMQTTIHAESFNAFQNLFQNSLPSNTSNGAENCEPSCDVHNLSWLLNYRIRELPPVPDAYNENANRANVVPTQQVNNVIVPQFESSKVIQKEKNSADRKPPFTYTDLIEYALFQKGELTVSGIYNWITEHFPYYKNNDDRWKNSVRHNLSINPHFRKGTKATQGAGHLWTIEQRDEEKSLQMRQRIEEFLRTSGGSETNSRPTVNHQEDEMDRELHAATQSILEDMSTTNDEMFISQETSNSYRDVQVEFIDISEGINDIDDFLTPPAAEEVIVGQSGLQEDFFITNLETNEDEIFNDINLNCYSFK